MNAISKMVVTAKECFETPGRTSLWSQRLNRYVCSDDPEFSKTVDEQRASTALLYAPLNPAFRLVFLTAAGGTVFFTVICVASKFFAGQRPDLAALGDHFLDLVKIGFGAIVGLLGAHSLEAH